MKGYPYVSIPRSKLHLALHSQIRVLYGRSSPSLLCEVFPAWSSKLHCMFRSHIIIFVQAQHPANAARVSLIIQDCPSLLLLPLPSFLIQDQIMIARSSHPCSPSHLSLDQVSLSSQAVPSSASRERSSPVPTSSPPHRLEVIFHHPADYVMNHVDSVSGQW